MKCKNLECENETNGKNIYCSLKCRNIYVNKYIRNYDKVKETFKQKRYENEVIYLSSPKICKNCESIIPYDKIQDNGNFCSHKCSAIINNKKRKGTKYNLTDEGRNALIDSAYKNFLFDKKDLYLKEKSIYYDNPNKCLNCNEILEYKFRNRTYCNAKCKKEYYLKNMSDYKMYHDLSGFKFSLKDYEFDFKLVEKYGWYSAKNRGNNVNGVSRDHMFSVREGFRRLISPLLLAHPANCELIVNRNNQSKCDDCSITLEELEKRIEDFDERHGKYYKETVNKFIDILELKNLYGKVV